jgi:3-methyladenine DNA glycosylase Mpg
MLIAGQFNSSDLTEGDLRIVEGEEISNLIQTTRVGITNGAEKPWRFYSADDQEWVSKK